MHKMDHPFYKEGYGRVRRHLARVPRLVGRRRRAAWSRCVPGCRRCSARPPGRCSEACCSPRRRSALLLRVWPGEARGSHASPPRWLGGRRSAGAAQSRAPDPAIASQSRITTMPSALPGLPSKKCDRQQSVPRQGRGACLRSEQLPKRQIPA